MSKRELSPGTVVHKRYRIDKVLGSGGFGVTYKVYDLKDNCPAAMKEYMPLDAAYRPTGTQEVRPVSESKRKQYEKFRQQFLDEAQTIYKFRGHPNIVEVRHLFYENNTAYYVMEYIEGMDLGKFLKTQGGMVRWDTLRPIMAQVVSALKQVHGANMIHCDISQDNIFLLNAGQVKLLDFGAARNTLRGSAETSVIVAKIGFAPYEQMRGKNMGPWTDIYALAVTIYHCITGKMPPKSEERIINDSTIWPSQMSQMGVAIPSAQWEQTLKKAMAVRWEDRYRSVVDFWNGLTPQIYTTPAPYSQPVPSQGWSKPMPKQDPATVQEYGKFQNAQYVPPQQYSQPQYGGAPVLECVQGMYKGSRIPITQEMLLGVDNTQCRITFPPGTPGISRVHLRLWSSGGQLMVMDMGSTYGSWLAGKKMTPGLVYQMNPGMVIYLGGGQMFRAAES